MKNENIMRFARELQTTDKRQVQGNLEKVSLDSDGRTLLSGFCCMGIAGLLAGAERWAPSVDEVHAWYASIEPDSAERPLACFGAAKVTSLPPTEVHEWLGLPPLGDADEADLFLDDEEFTYLNDVGEGEASRISLATLNDSWELTFAQIGDLIAHFGLTSTQQLRLEARQRREGL